MSHVHAPVRILMRSGFTGIGHWKNWVQGCGLVTLLVGTVRAYAAGIFGANQQEDPSPYFVRTLAGSGIAGALDQPVGLAAAARFYRSEGLAVDLDGNVIVADTENRTIRRIRPNGEVTTLAGEAQVVGYRDGPGIQARFSGPSSVAVDRWGMIYVADSTSHVIRQVDTNGVVTTLAGRAWQPGFVDGPGSLAQFHIPAGVAVDLERNVYVADRLNHVIRKIDPAGNVTLLAGIPWSAGFSDGVLGIGRFRGPTAVAAGGGFVYVADTGNSSIRRIDPEGRLSTIAGFESRYGYRDGPGIQAWFNYPRGLAVDQGGNLYVADTANHLVRKISPLSVVTTIAGLVGHAGSYEGTGVSARFNEVRGVAVGPDGSLFVSDTWNHQVRKLIPGLEGGRFHVTSSSLRVGQTLDVRFEPAGLGWTWSWIYRPPHSTLPLPAEGSTRFQLVPDAIGLYVLRAATTNRFGAINWRHLEWVTLENTGISARRGLPAGRISMMVPGGPGIAGHVEGWILGGWHFLKRIPLPNPINEVESVPNPYEPSALFRVQYLPESVVPPK